MNHVIHTDQLGVGFGAVPEKALRDMCRRVWAGALRLPFDTLAVPAGDSRTPGVRYQGWCRVSFDGCVSPHCPDSERNRAWLGRAETGHGGLRSPAPTWPGRRSRPRG